MTCCPGICPKDLGKLAATLEALSAAQGGGIPGLQMQVQSRDNF